MIFFFVFLLAFAWSLDCVPGDCKHGVCVDGMCHCDMFYEGVRCNTCRTDDYAEHINTMCVLEHLSKLPRPIPTCWTKLASDPQVCSGHGKCHGPGNVCSCFKPYGGQNCHVDLGEEWSYA